MDDIKINSFKNPTTLSDMYTVDVPMNIASNRLRADVLFHIVSSLTETISKTILKEHGEEMIQEVLNKEAEIKEKIINAINKNIEWFAHELMVMERDFKNKELCQCGQVHGRLSSKMKVPTHLQHFFTPMTNLQYLEHRYDRIKAWIKGLDD